MGSHAHRADTAFCGFTNSVLTRCNVAEKRSTSEMSLGAYLCEATSALQAHRILRELVCHVSAEVTVSLNLRARDCVALMNVGS